MFGDWDVVYECELIDVVWMVEGELECDVVFVVVVGEVELFLFELLGDFDYVGCDCVF